MPIDAMTIWPKIADELVSLSSKGKRERNATKMGNNNPKTSVTGVNKERGNMPLRYPVKINLNKSRWKKLALPPGKNSGNFLASDGVIVGPYCDALKAKGNNTKKATPNPVAHNIQSVRFGDSLGRQFRQGNRRNIKINAAMKTHWG